MITCFRKLVGKTTVYWQANDNDILLRLNAHIRDTKRDPFKGIGKPEPLKGQLAGFLSRRITEQHRLVYKVEGTRPDQVLNNNSGSLSLLKRKNTYGL